MVHREYSNIISVSMNSNRVIIYPNPTSDLLYISGLEDKNIKFKYMIIMVN